MLQVTGFPVVIVAGGVGSRLRPYSEERPKTLMELEPGVTLLGFIISRMRRAGLGPIYIVTRREFADTLKKAVGGGARVITVDVDEFGNLYSVYTALKEVEPPFLVAMSDHIFEYELLRRIASHSSDKAFTICLDREPTALEAREGLKVRIEGGRIVAVGKNLETRYGIDTGLIMVRPGAVPYIEKVVGEKGPQASIGDALNLAARDGEVDYVDVTGLLWKDIDTPDDLLEARRLYKRILLRDYGRRSAGPASELLARPITLRVAAGAGLKRRAAVAASAAVAEVAFASLFLAAGTGWPMLLPAIAYAILLLSDLGDVSLSLLGAPRGLRALLAAAEAASAALVASSLAAQVWFDTSPLLLLPVSTLAASTVAAVALVDHSDAPPTAAASLADPAIRYMLAGLAPLAGLQVAALAYWAASGLAALLSAVRFRPAIEVPEEAFPRIEGGVREVRRALEEAVVGALKLSLALIAISLVQGALGDLRVTIAEGMELTLGGVASAFALLVVIYYGYRVIAGVKALADVMSWKLADAFGVTTSAAKHIALDLVYLAVSGLLLLLAPRLAGGVPLVGEPLSKIVAAALIAAFVFFLYDLAKVTYSLFRGVFASLLEKLVKPREEQSRQSPPAKESG